MPTLRLGLLERNDDPIESSYLGENSLPVDAQATDQVIHALNDTP